MRSRPADNQRFNPNANSRRESERCAFNPRDRRLSRCYRVDSSPNGVSLFVLDAAASSEVLLWIILPDQMFYY